jgi:hypothetical protein
VPGTIAPGHYQVHLHGDFSTDSVGTVMVDSQPPLTYKVTAAAGSSADLSGSGFAIGTVRLQPGSSIQLLSAQAPETPEPISLIAIQLRPALMK